MRQLQELTSLLRFLRLNWPFEDAVRHHAHSRLQMFEGQISTIGTEQTLHPHVIKIQLYQYLCKLEKGM